MHLPRLNLRVRLFVAVLIFGSLQIAVPSAHAQQVVISEIMAVNDSTLADEDGDFSDWIEIWNRGAGSVNLDGWHLTDNLADLTKWTFPAEVLEADSLMIVFASSKDRSVTGMPLHTNFKLTGGGEYMALVEPDGSTIAAEFAPAFPALGSDESYGLEFISTSTVSIVSHGASARSLAPVDGSLGTNWTTLGGIDDSSWRQGPTGIGFDFTGNFDPLISTDVEDLMTGPDRDSCYIRIPFFYQAISNLNGVSLDIQYDDGFVAYLNGVELASRNAPASPQWDSMATLNKDDLTAGNIEQIQVLGAETLLSPGTNLLAIHGLNLVDSPFLKNFLIDPALSGVSVAESLSILAVPTPGTANSQAAASVNFAPPGGMFASAPVVNLSSDPAAAPIYYTLDGSQPTTNSMLYSAPIVPAGSGQIRARSIESSGREGPIRSEHYIVLAADLLSFSSDLPLVVIENFGGGDAVENLYRPFHLGIFELPGDRTSLTNAAVLATRAGVRKRGSSSVGRDKVSYSVEAWNEQDADKTISPLGMPDESDWILYGPYNFDRAMIRNTFIYEMSKQAGRYAVRHRFVELFRNIDGGDLSYADDYRGVYIWMEKIKQDPSRVDIDKISPSDLAEPEISGGYMIKVDRPDPGDSGFTAGGISLLNVDPKESEMETTYASQAAWLTNYINQLGVALNGAGFGDPDTGYRAYLDADTVIDYFILNEFMTRNPDAAWASMYMFKPRSGKLMFGPIWDFDRTMGCADDGRSANPAIWTTDVVFTFAWWPRLFDDPDLWQGMIDRWQALRGDVLSLSNILSVVDRQSAELQEAQARNFAKWTGIPPRGGSYEAEVDLLRTWLSNRVEWLDDQFLDPPVIVPGSSVFESGNPLTMSGPVGTTIYYTLDGSDPRAPGGAPAAGATLYGGPFSLSDDAVVVARAWDGQAWTEPQISAPWSAPTREVYVSNPAELTLTEVMYNPRQALTNQLAAGLSGGDFEFIELQHTGLEAGSLLGVSFSDGIAFDFTAGALTSLAPGESIVVVRNLDAFTNRYAGWATMNIAGEFTGSLNNDGEAIALSSEVASGGLWRITFDDKRGWPVAADGAGHSLVPLDADPRLLDYGGNWRASAFIDGSPGTADPAPASSVMLNEFMAHTDFTNPVLPEYDSDDWIELYNAGTAVVSLADWYLSDDADRLAQWAIPASNMIAAGAWLSFDEVTGFHSPITNGFGLDKAGEGVFLSYLPGTSADRVVDSVRFKGQERTASLGRSADGGKYWRALDLTRDTTNAVPPEHIVISEIMYHPTATNVADNLRDEFIEIFNPLGVPVDLWTEAGSWRIAGGVNCTFPTNTTLGDGEAVLLVSFDPADASARNGFLATYALTNGEVRLFGPCTGLLSDRGERIALEQPQSADVVGDPVSWVIVDEVIYYDRWPWADAADGTGQSLQRTGTGGAGRDPANWIALAPTPGGLSKIVITAPVAGAPYFLPIEVDVNAFVDVLQVSGAVQEVRFYHGTNGFGTDASAPYTASLSYAGPPGDVSLRASVEDVVGVDTSTPVRIIAQAIDSAQGARDVTDFSAVLQGRLTGGGVADATFAWGSLDGGTNLNDWAHAQSVGSVGTGTFELAVVNLRTHTNYTYRVHAANVNGETWSSAAPDFSTRKLEQWPYRMPVTFACAGSGLMLSNFPVLVQLHEGLTNFSYGQFASAAGHDLRFAGADGEVLSYEIERWNTNGTSALWLRIPSLTNGTAVQVYWGFASAASASPPNAVDGSAWSGGYQAVWHLEGDLSDSTLNGSVITDEGSSSAAGIVAGGRSLDGSDDALHLALSHAWYQANREAMTISLWVRPAVVSGSTVFSTGGDTNLYVSMSTFITKWIGTLQGVGHIGHSYDADLWQRLSFVFETGRVSMVQNDLVPTDLGNASGLSFLAPPAIGIRLGVGSYLDACVDDVRISGVGRSVAWLVAEYATVAEHDSFTCYGPVTTQDDLDGDRLPDAWEEEMLGGTNAAAGDDTDLDGLDNEGEFIAGTDPTNAASVFTVELDMIGGEVIVRFTALEAVGPGYAGLERYYDLERSSNLILQVWPGVSGFSNIIGQGQLVIHSNWVPHSTYFRARTRLE